MNFGWMHQTQHFNLISNFKSEEEEKRPSTGWLFGSDIFLSTLPQSWKNLNPIYCAVRFKKKEHFHCCSWNDSSTTLPSWDISAGDSFSFQNISQDERAPMLSVSEHPRKYLHYIKYKWMTVQYRYNRNLSDEFPFLVWNYGPKGIVRICFQSIDIEFSFDEHQF